MFAVPLPIPVTLPFASTVATFLSDELQVMFLLSAFSGRTVAVSVSVSPLWRVSSFLLSFTEPAGSVTSTSHCALKPPSSVVTVITALPLLIPETVPLFTTATASSDELHVTFLL